jgi:hypothetical protein
LPALSAGRTTFAAETVALIQSWPALGCAITLEFRCMMIPPPHQTSTASRTPDGPRIGILEHQGRAGV